MGKYYSLFFPLFWHWWHLPSDLFILRRFLVWHLLYLHSLASQSYTHWTAWGTARYLCNSMYWWSETHIYVPHLVISIVLVNLLFWAYLLGVLLSPNSSYTSTMRFPSCLSSGAPAWWLTDIPCSSVLLGRLVTAIRDNLGAWLFLPQWSRFPWVPALN